jgi:hypothetical protein
MLQQLAHLRSQLERQRTWNFSNLGVSSAAVVFKNRLPTGIVIVSVFADLWVRFPSAVLQLKARTLTVFAN